MDDKLLSAFSAAIREFVEHRKTHGGILLPNAAIIRDAFQEALYRTDVEKRPTPTPIIGTPQTISLKQPK